MVKKYLLIVSMLFISNISMADNLVLNCPSLDQISVHGEKDLRSPGGWIGKYYKGRYNPNQSEPFADIRSTLYREGGTCDYFNSYAELEFSIFNIHFNPNHRLYAHSLGNTGLSNCWDNPQNSQQDCYWIESFS